MGLYFDNGKYIRQMLIGGSVYTPSWYLSLAKGGSNPYSTIRDTWEVPGTATALTTTWQDDSLTSSSSYLSVISNTTTVNVTVPNAATITYWVIRDGLATDKWQFLGRFNNYPLSVAAGDTLRFLPGTLKIGFST
jgi:hypothetical protein